MGCGELYPAPLKSRWPFGDHTSTIRFPGADKPLLSLTLSSKHNMRHMQHKPHQVPISATRAINRFCLIRNFATLPALDWMARQ